MREFYAPFINPGDLVFDVGANIGSYSELFTELGAKVVAIEPNPRCCKTLRKLAKTRQVVVEEYAVGEEQGSAKMRICEQSALSTLTDRWYEKSQQSPLLRDAQWLGEIEVEITTLDQLAKRHGVPRFVKIDVEGYDDRVLRGMSFQPETFSFEFTRRAPEVAMRCLETEVLADRYQYNYVRGMDMRLAQESWVSVKELRARLNAISGDEEYGDVLGRLLG